MNNLNTHLLGHLDIIVHDNQEEFEGSVSEWRAVLIHGDPDGLKSLANILLKLAEVDQESNDRLPIGAREHVHLRPKFELGISSVEVIVGRLDAKGTGAFFDSYESKGNAD